MSELSDLKESVRLLREEVDKLMSKQEDLNSTTNTYVEKVGEAGALWKSTYKSVGSVYTKLSEFTFDLNEQYKLSEKLAEAYKQTSVNIGIGRQNQKLLGDEFSNSVKLVQMLGGDVDDVSTIYNRFSENSGRVRILDDEEVQRIFAIEKSTGMAGDSAAMLAERFDLMGIGSEMFAENINQIMTDSQKIGLNSSKVIKVLSDNFENMQRMSFRGGVKAMSEMSKLAVKMRMDVSDMLGMADKFYEPEAAIEAAAQLQLMGGDIAEAFGDPFETMYLARNKPEELAKRLQGMTENMVSFNEETGQYELPAEARQQLSFAAEQLGLAKDSVIDMAFQSSKIKDISLNVGGNFTEEELDKISSIAKFKDGKWSVDIGDETISVDELDSSQLEEALAKPTTEKDAALLTAQESMTTNEKLQSIFEATQTGIAIESKFYQTIEKQMSPQIDSLIEGNDKVIEKMVSSLKENVGTVMPEGTMEEVTSAVSNITNATIKSIFAEFEKNKTTDEVKKIANKPTKEGDDEVTTPVIKSEDLYSGPGDSGRVLTGSFGAFQLDSRDLIAAGDPEKLMGSINSQTSNGKMDVSGTVTIVIPDITVNGKTLEDNSETKRKIEKMVNDAVIGGTEKVLNLKQSGMNANTGG